MQIPGGPPVLAGFRERSIFIFLFSSFWNENCNFVMMSVIG